MLKSSIESFLKRLCGESAQDPLLEGLWADQYGESAQDRIRRDYLRRWHPELQPRTPQTHPWLFDPCEPPEGWRYDPYYETWMKIR